MALKLDDFLTKKKEPVQILDLSRSSANSHEELKKMVEKVPEYKIKMDKIRPEEVKVFEKKSDDEKVKASTTFAYANPIPSDMRSLRLEDLCAVNIQWKMLTSLRPKLKSDEDYFSKLVELGKLQLHARLKERNKTVTWYVRKSKNKAGITEMKIISCRECGEEFCLNEICRVFAYDSYERCVTLNEKQLMQRQENTTSNTKKAKRTKKAKSKAKAKSQRTATKKSYKTKKPKPKPKPKPKLKPSRPKSDQQAVKTAAAAVKPTIRDKISKVK